MFTCRRCSHVRGGDNGEREKRRREEKMPAISLYVRRLPESATSARLTEIFSEIGPLKKCFVVSDRESKKCRGFGYVTFSMEEDGQRAMKDVKQYDGENIFMSVAKRKPDNKKRKNAKTASGETEAEHKPAERHQEKFTGLRKNKLKARLIVRNLSFKCTEDHLRKVFSEFGSVLEAKIPLKEDGKMRGFAFVQFQNLHQAEKALKATNMTEIMSRPVAVDWAIAKDKYTAMQSGGASKKEAELTATEVTEGETQSERVKDEPVEEEEEEEEEDDDDEDEDDAESHGSDDDASDPEDEDDDDDEEDEKVKKAPAQKRKLRPSDVSEGRTLFIRNLSFDTDEEGLEEALLKFGQLNYALVVTNHDTGLSKGMAFVQFRTKDAADKCLAAAAAQKASDSGGVRVDGRKLDVTVAVSREDAAKFKETKVKTHTGSRNLYLAREGLIRPGSKAAEGVSETDMARRRQIEDVKREKLKLVNVHVSKTRLCVHNIPKSVDNTRLRKLCLTAAASQDARITECRVMYDQKPVSGQVMGHSLGYGFVEFSRHDHALHALRQLNNNPAPFGPHKRPIVEFSLEDERKLKMKAARLENSRRKLKKPEDRRPNKGAKSVPTERRAGKRKAGAASAPPTDRAQFGGFRTRPEAEQVELQDGRKRQKVLHMPSHRGPKIRQRDKGKQPAKPVKMKSAPSRKERSHQADAHRKQVVKGRSQGRSREDFRFDRLVQQYKQKLTGNFGKKTPLVKKSKWFS